MLWGISRFNDSQKTWTMIACAVIGIAISMYSLLCREILEANVVQTFRLWIWLFYFILGSNMDKIHTKIFKFANAYFLAVIMTVLNIAWQEYISCLLWSTLGELGYMQNIIMITYLR